MEEASRDPEKECVARCSQERDERHGIAVPAPKVQRECDAGERRGDDAKPRRRACGAPSRCPGDFQERERHVSSLVRRPQGAVGPGLTQERVQN